MFPKTLNQTLFKKILFQDNDKIYEDYLIFINSNIINIKFVFN